MLQRFSKRVSIYTPVVFSSQRFIYISCIFLNYVFDNECIYIYIYIYLYIYTYIKKKVTRGLRLTKVHRARRINKDSQSKLHSKQERGELRKMRGWTTSNVKKIKNLIKTFRSETFFSYLQPLNKKEL